MGGVASSEIYASEMFHSTVEKLIKAIGEKEFIPSTSVLSAEDIELMSIIERKASMWWFGKNSYNSTEFMLSDVTKPPISKNKVKTSANEVYVEFKEVIKLQVAGKVEGQFRQMFGALLDNHDTVSVHAPVGDVQLIEVHQQSLLDAIKTSKLNMRHQLVRELAAKPRMAMCVVVGILRTVTECTLTASLDVDFKTDIKAGVSSHGGDGGLAVSTDKTRELKIPAGVPLAYHVRELSVDRIGSMQVMVSGEVQGGFQSYIFDTFEETYSSPGDEVGQGFGLRLDALFAPLTTLSPHEKKQLVEDLKVVLNDEALLTELYRALKLKQSANQSVQRCLDVGETKSVRFSILALLRALRDLPHNAQHQVMSFLDDPESLTQVISILASTFSGSPKTVMKPIPERIVYLLLEGVDYTIKEVQDTVQLQTKGGVYSTEARSAYIALDGLRVLQQENLHIL